MKVQSQTKAWGNTSCQLELSLKFWNLFLEILYLRESEACNNKKFFANLWLLLLMWSPCPPRSWHPCFCNVFEPQNQVRRSQPTRKANSRFLFSPQKRNGTALRARHKKNLARPIYLRFSQQTDKRTSICTVSPLSALACNKYFIEQKKKERKLK